ncbi:hypothetical protein Clacol_004541 [Clathrus columnatus]|uniref:Major facilitator superfamily (MFS) profile domain-containing protein n=1 Tax=Clathrus columnatus TaxID=1419009 RepID=A0AAV5AEE7_9AGAM|nr:hypothetical protein Clacol_004541 [Clathrus columnatus]
MNDSNQYSAVSQKEIQTDNADLQQPKSESLVPEMVDVIYDKGPRALAALLGGFFASVATFGYVNAFGVYQDFYTRFGTSSPSAISWIGSTQLFFMLAMGLVGGKLLDMGYFRHTIFIGSVIYVFCLFMLSLAHADKYYQIYLSQGLGMGIGAGLIYVPALAIQSHHWRTHRAAALGVVVTGSSLGGIIFPVMLNQLINGSVGFAWGVRASAFLNLGLLVLANILMTPNQALASSEKPKPDMKGILTDFPYIMGNIAFLPSVIRHSTWSELYSRILYGP